MTLDLTETSLYHYPHAFIDREHEPVLIELLGAKRHRQLVDLYLAYEPRNSFSGLPPITDAACIAWVEGMTETGINLVALSFDRGIAGHLALFPINAESTEMLVVVCPAKQRVGIGTELTRCASQLAHELGFETLRLCVEAHNHLARHVYEKCGFQYHSYGMIGELDMSLDLRFHHDVADVPVREVMNPHVIAVQQDLSCEAALGMFLADRIATLPVIGERGQLTGILSETDLLAEDSLSHRVGDVMTRGVVTVHDGDPLAKVIRLFRSRKLRCVPVLDHHGELVGVVGRRDVLAYYARRLAARRPHGAPA